MAFKMVILPGVSSQTKDIPERMDWPARIRAVVPDCDVRMPKTQQEVMTEIVDADAAYGDVKPEIFRQAKKLRWIMSPWAAPYVGYFHKDLVESKVVVTSPRATFNEHLATHIMAFLLCFARGFQRFIPQQTRRYWQPDVWESQGIIIHLPETTALIIGVGGSGAETARLCAAFGIKVIGMDPRVTVPPPGVAEMHKPGALHTLLPRADFVIMTVPMTPQTARMMAAPQFRLMKKTAFLINVGRGGTVALDDLTEAIRSGQIAGAGLDVFEQEPLPADHPLWTMPGVLITPHFAGFGPHIDERWTEQLVENCRRFDKGLPLVNVMDKANWF